MRSPPSGGHRRVAGRRRSSDRDDNAGPKRRSQSEPFLPDWYRGPDLRDRAQTTGRPPDRPVARLGETPSRRLLLGSPNGYGTYALNCRAAAAWLPGSGRVPSNFISPGRHTLRGLPVRSQCPPVANDRLSRTVRRRRGGPLVRRRGVSLRRTPASRCQGGDPAVARGLNRRPTACTR